MLDIFAEDSNIRLLRSKAFPLVTSLVGVELSLHSLQIHQQTPVARL